MFMDGPFFRKFLRISGILTVIVGLYVSSVYNYLFFHTLIEAVGVLIAVSVFLLSWNARNIMKSSYLLFISITLLFVGLLDMVHLLAYDGMNIFVGYDANLPTQLWVASRFILVISLAIAPVFFYKKLNTSAAYIVFSAVTVLIALSTFRWQIFPDAYVEGSLTLFKVLSEYVIVAIFLLATYLLFRQRHRFDRHVAAYLAVSLGFGIVAELFFSLYGQVTDVYNFSGHIAKLFSYYFIYKAIIEVGLTTPYRLLFLELEEMNRKKDEFVSFVSHELKTPLSAAKMQAELIEQGMLEKDEEREAVRDIGAELERINMIINDLNQVGRLDAGAVELHFEKFIINDLVEEVVAERIRYTPTRKIRVETEDRIKIKADITRMRQVLVNLISNACKYSPDRKEVVVRLSKHKRKLMIRVRDHGIGIPKEEQRLIFDKYYRVKNTTYKPGGTGLGLYIAKQLVEMHGGTITVDSKVGEGSEFQVTLPLTEHAPRFFIPPVQS
jgi:signal transduction histidine kinase